MGVITGISELTNYVYTSFPMKYCGNDVLFDFIINLNFKIVNSRLLTKKETLNYILKILLIFSI